MSMLFKEIATQLGAELIQDEYKCKLKTDQYTLIIKGVSKLSKYDTFYDCDADENIQLVIFSATEPTLFGHSIDGHKKITMSSDRAVKSIANSITNRIIPHAIHQQKQRNVLNDKEILFKNGFDIICKRLSNIDNATYYRHSTKMEAQLTIKGSGEAFALTFDVFNMAMEVNVKMQSLTPLSLLSDQPLAPKPNLIKQSNNEGLAMYSFSYANRAYNNPNATDPAFIYMLLDCFVATQPTPLKYGATA